MRVQVVGNCQGAEELRLLLRMSGFVVTDKPAQYPTTVQYTIIVNEGKQLTIDSIDCPLDRKIRQCIGELTACDIILRHAGGRVFSDRMIEVTYPPEQQEQVITGVRRGIALAVPLTEETPEPELEQAVTVHGDTARPVGKPWWERLFHP